MVRYFFQCITTHRAKNKQTNKNRTVQSTALPERRTVQCAALPDRQAVQCAALPERRTVECAALPERRRCINCHRGAGAHAERAEGQWRTKVSGSKSVADQSHWDQSQWRTKGAGGACCRLLAAMACSRRSVSSHAASSFTANRCPRLSLGHSGSPSSFERRGNGRVTAGNGG